MDALREKILKEGEAIGTQIVKVDGFLNHRIDVKFMEKIGEEFKKRFSDVQVTKILTVEASGIVIAALASIYFGYPPVVFAKKVSPNTMTEDFYGAAVKSFTKGTVSIIRVSKKFLAPNEKILILDDFLAHGEAALGLSNLVEQAGAQVVGIGAVIEKQFQGGGEKLRKNGYRVESLAVIKEINGGEIVFA